MSCNQYDLAEVFDYSDGSLDAGRRQSFEAHVKACADCRTALVDVRRIASDLERMPILAPEPPVGLRDAVMADAEGLLMRLREEGTALARPFRAGSAPTLGTDSPRPDSPTERRSRTSTGSPTVPWHGRPVPRFAALAAAILVIVTIVNFVLDRRVVASILDGENVLVNGAPYVSGTVELEPGSVIVTESHRAGSFISSSGESVVLGPSSRLVVLERDDDGCLVLKLESGRAWILIDEGSGKPAGVDMESGTGTHASLRGGEAFVYKDPQGIRIVADSFGGPGDMFPGCAQLERARLDEVAVEILQELAPKTQDPSPKTTERARNHYDRVKPFPIHWVKDLRHAEIIAWNLKRPLLIVDESGGLADDLFRDDAALRKAASRYVCVRIQHGSPEAEKLLSSVEQPERRNSPRVLLCPELTWKGSFGADTPIAELAAQMEKVCDDVTANWKKK